MREAWVLFVSLSLFELRESAVKTFVAAESAVAKPV
jgi:hypothetical protein